LNRDARAEIVTGAGSGGGPHVKVFDGQTGNLLQSFYAYDPAFTGGVTVAASRQMNAFDIITGAGPGGGPHVEEFDFENRLELLQSFYAYDPSFAGGVFVAAGDAGIITGAGPGGGPHVKVFSGFDRRVLQSFFAYDPAFAGGVRVGMLSSDDANGRALRVGPGPGGSPNVRDFHPETLDVLDSFFAFDPRFRGGVFVG
jgi:hypothetical protein